MGQVELSFVIPAYNEEVFIEDTLGTLDLAIKEKMFEYEIVVVEDGYLDGTTGKIKKIDDSHIKIFGY